MSHEFRNLCISASGVLVSSLIGFYGIWLGHKSLNQISEIESNKIQPMIQFTLNHGPEERVSFENVGFGPAVVEHMILWKKAPFGDDFQSFEYEEYPDYVKLEKFLGIYEHNVNDAANGGPALMWYYGPNSILTPGDAADVILLENALGRPAGWGAKYRNKFRFVVDNLAICLIYVSLDGRRYKSDYNGGCAGEIVSHLNLEGAIDKIRNR